MPPMAPCTLATHIIPAALPSIRKIVEASPAQFSCMYLKHFTKFAPLLSNYGSRKRLKIPASTFAETRLQEQGLPEPSLKHLGTYFPSNSTAPQQIQFSIAARDWNDPKHQATDSSLDHQKKTTCQFRLRVLAVLCFSAFQLGVCVTTRLLIDRRTGARHHDQLVSASSRFAIFFRTLPPQFCLKMDSVNRVLTKDIHRLPEPCATPNVKLDRPAQWAIMMPHFSRH